MTSNFDCSKQALHFRMFAEKVARLRDSNFSPGEELLLDETKQFKYEESVSLVKIESQNDELRTTQAELEVSRARYFDLFNQAPVGYVTFNEDGLVLEINLTAANLFGLPAGELENKLLSHCILPEDQDAFSHHLIKLFATGLPQECELRMIRNDLVSGDIVFLARMKCSVLKPDLTSKTVPGSNCQRCIVVVSDVTENHKLTEQLHQAKEMEAMSLLAAGVAQEFNNKLEVVIGHAKLALDKDVSQHTARGVLEQILTAAQLSAVLTRQLIPAALQQMTSRSSDRSESGV